MTSLHVYCLLIALLTTLSSVLTQEECYRLKAGVDYRGHMNVTKTGRACQYWGSQTPHSHSFGYLYDQRNYCRNPDNEPKGTWCYTQDNSTRWEYCNVFKCAKPFDPCFSRPCQNGGTCSSRNRKYICTCTSDWTGKQCESKAPWKSCDSKPCQNGGTCLETEYSFSCVCPSSWMGNLCNVPGTTYRCDSENGWTQYGTSCYKVYDTAASWENALNLCHFDYADLVSISDELVQTIVHNMSRQVQADLWTGVKLNQGEWVDSKYQKFGYKKYWKNGTNIPSSGESCVAVDRTAPDKADWYVDICDTDKYFVCSKPEGSCPAGYYFYKHRCYLYKPLMLGSWYNAKQFCEGSDTQLIDIYDLDEQLFAATLCQQMSVLDEKRVWLGLQASSGNGWRWNNDDDEATFSNWFSNSSSSTYECAYFDIETGGKWYNSLPCTTPLSVLCVVDVNNVQWPDSKVVDNSSCGVDWHIDISTGYCYKADGDLKTWTEAQEACKKDGAHLVSIGSQKEQSFISGFLTGYYDFSSIWIGANSLASGEGWSWTDGTPFAFYNWFPGEPDNDVTDLQECVSMLGKYTQWSDSSCSQLHPYMCEKKIPEKSYSLTTPAFPETNSLPVLNYSCSSGWVEYNNQCFLVVRQKKTWFEAKEYCSSIGGKLITISDTNFHNFIYSQLPSEYCFNLHPNDTICNELAAAGKCSSDPIYMARKCQSACKLCIRNCRDFYDTSSCQMWAKEQMCKVNAEWMVKNCAMSCGVCDYAMKGGFWIGLNDIKRRGTFTWSDGKKVTFTLWTQNEPDGGISVNYQGSKGLCVVMSLMDGRWFDTNCDDVMAGFVCKNEKSSLRTTTISAITAGCPKKTIAYDAYCYGTSDDKKSWSSAQTACSSANGTLATINNRFLQAFLSSELAQENDAFWVGFYRNKTNTYWINQETVQFLFSGPQEKQSNESTTCGAMHTERYGMWLQHDCRIRLRYLCQYSRSGYTTSSVTTTMVTTPKPACPSGWMTNGDNCYKFFNEKQSCENARWACRSIGADLVKITSQSEDNFIGSIQLRNQYSIWIGLSDRATESVWKWSDGTSLSFENWRNGQPDDYYSNEDCVVKTYHDFKWVDQPCSIARPFICQTRKGSPVKQNISLKERIKCSGSDFYYFDGWCYFVQNDTSKFTFFEAERYCHGRGSHLASVHNWNELNFILSLMSSFSSNAWIGLSESNTELQYRWTDGSSLDFVAWAKNEPNGRGDEKCVQMHERSGTWMDYTCSYPVKTCICKRKNDTSTSVITTTTPVPRKGGCPPGFVSSPTSDKCYLVGSMGHGDIKLTWYEAKSKCKQYGREFSLLSIKNSEEQVFVTSLMRGLTFGIWNGMYKLITDKFAWIDNTEVTFTNWMSGQPGYYGSRCATMWTVFRSGQWSASNCMNKYGYICQTYKDPKYPEQSAKECPSGYTKHAVSCYKFISLKLNHKSAKQNCENQGATLTSISNRFENAYVESMSSSKDHVPFWIGLSQTEETTMYKWDDGTPYIYEKWSTSLSLRTQRKKCVLFQNTTWRDIDCNLELSSICEISLVEIPDEPASPCPKHALSFNSACYYWEHSKRSWADANRFCRSVQMELASIHSAFEMEHILEYALKQSSYKVPPNTWIGLSRLPKPDRPFFKGWYWSDGTDYLYNHFVNGEPKDIIYNTNKQCIEIINGWWNNIPCSSKRSFICKQTVYGTTESPTTEATSYLDNTTTQASSSILTRIATTTEASNISTITTTATTEKHPVRQSPTAKKTLKESDMSSLGVAGIVVGIILIILVSVLIVLFVWKRFGRDSYTGSPSVGFENALYKGKGVLLECPGP